MYLILLVYLILVVIITAYYSHKVSRHAYDEHYKPMKNVRIKKLHLIGCFFIILPAMLIPGVNVVLIKKLSKGVKYVL